MQLATAQEDGETFQSQVNSTKVHDHHGLPVQGTRSCTASTAWTTHRHLSGPTIPRSIRTSARPSVRPCPASCSSLRRTKPSFVHTAVIPQTQRNSAIRFEDIKAVNAHHEVPYLLRVLRRGRARLQGRHQHRAERRGHKEGICAEQSNAKGSAHFSLMTPNPSPSPIGSTASASTVSCTLPVLTTSSHHSSHLRLHHARQIAEQRHLGQGGA